MTNMKALSLLDHVCLLVARIMAGFLFLSSCTELAVPFFHDELSSVFTPARIFCDLAGATVLLGAVLLLPRFSTRFVLATVAILHLSRIVVSIATYPYLFFIADLNPHYWYVLVEILLLPLIQISGLLAMIWVSIRLPQNSKPADTSFNDQHLPQSC